jgi:hypothetical protein
MTKSFTLSFPLPIAPEARFQRDGEGVGVGRNNERCACIFTPPRPQLALQATLPVKGEGVTHLQDHRPQR